MSAWDALKRELRVAFSLRAQPIWFRILKWAIALGVGVILWRSPFFWWWVACGLGLGLTVHFIWRWKTKGWTEPWGGWNDIETARRD